MNSKGDFPHEMGILFGYPVEDVTGFIDNQGKNLLYCGYWKVYSNAEEKIELFQRFQKAQDRAVKLIVYGLKINQITELFKYNNKLLNGDGLICNEAPDNDAIKQCENLGKQLVEILKF